MNALLLFQYTLEFPYWDMNEVEKCTVIQIGTIKLDDERLLIGSTLYKAIS